MNTFFGVDARFLDRRGCGDEFELDVRMKSALLFQELGGVVSPELAADLDSEDFDELANH